MSSKPYRHFIALLLVLFCSRFEAQAEDLFAKTDSTLQQYLIRCKAQIKDPDFLQTNDTLTHMAQEKNDKRMQVIAVALKLDYYYYQNNPDSILVMVDRVKKISRRNNELKYFYFAWGSRLIIYYIKQHQTNTAIYEARKMLQSAEADNFIPGIVQCYRTLGTIYMTQSNPKLAYENFRKQIALIEENEIEDINLPTQYASLAQCALEMHRPDEALKALEKGSKCTRSSYQIFTVQKAYILYYLETKEYEKARKTLVELEQLFEKDKSLTLYKSGLFYIQIEYYRNTGQYRKALNVIEEIKNDSSSINKYLDYTLTQKQGDIYWEMNQKARAVQYYRDYILATDSIRSQEIQNSTNEFYTIMEVEQLHKEKNELLLHMQEEKLQKIRENAIAQIENSDGLAKLNDVRVAVLGKKGELTAVLKSMKEVAPEDRPKVGQWVNETRQEIENKLDEMKKKLEAAELEHRLENEVIDVTLPAKKNRVGHSHPNTMVLEEVERIFTGMGYEVVEGPEVEYDYYNFEALNIPANHPAKDEQDTFYINDKILLRTQTSPVQVRVMEQKKPPIRMIAPGRVFRADEVDATHSPSFHQIEGMVIDKGITFSNLKGTLTQFVQKLFGKETKVKFRPHHFPFTEPSAEMDVSCFKCGGKGCRFCKGEGWIEILGCGMVHPRVLRMSGIDPEEYSGFAFGIGLERITLLKYEIDDMRLLYENDDRFLKQF